MWDGDPLVPSVAPRALARLSRCPATTASPSSQPPSSPWPRRRPIAGTHTAGASEEAVALDHGTLAFARRAGKHTTVLVKRLSARSPARVAASLPHANITGIALSRAALAFTVDSFVEDPGESRLYLKPAGRRVRQVARGGFGEENRREHESPTIAGRYLYWAYANQSEVAPANGWVARCDLRTGTTTAAAAPGYLDSVAADARQAAAPLLVTSFSQETDETHGVDQVATLDAPVWRAAPSALSLTRGGPCRG